MHLAISTKSCVVSLIYFDTKKLKRLSDSKVWEWLPTSLVKHFFRQAPIRIWMLRLATVLEDLDIGQRCWVFVTIVTTPRTWPNQISLQPFLCYGAWSFNKISHLKRSRFLSLTTWSEISPSIFFWKLKNSIWCNLCSPWGSTSFDQPHLMCPLAQQHQQLMTRHGLNIFPHAKQTMGNPNGAPIKVILTIRGDRIPVTSCASRPENDDGRNSQAN